MSALEIQAATSAVYSRVSCQAKSKEEELQRSFAAQNELRMAKHINKM
jgi:hypothetical protein